MDRFYFNIHDGERFTRDGDAHLCQSHKAMRDAAIKVLPDIARDELPDGDQRNFTVKVRDESGHFLLEATLSLTVNRLKHQDE